METQQAIDSIPLGMFDRPDKRTWPHTKNGRYTVKSGYYAIRTSIPRQLQLNLLNMFYLPANGLELYGLLFVVLELIGRVLLLWINGFYMSGIVSRIMARCDFVYKQQEIDSGGVVYRVQGAIREFLNLSHKKKLSSTQGNMEAVQQEYGVEMESLRHISLFVF
ncbi:putative ribonuclease H protein [Corchorus olitorius]|uniref:Ribonuclease H protein n=1 Tax=Corchorus olitorius TaxID=93759 RepID=A0A1R3IG23_9ROSI|nr:putative ribonuclease H protein [Corchorus olitorius]